MRCPFCHGADTKVTDSRLAQEGDAVKRRRQCNHCQGRFTTFETAELLMPRVIKRNGDRESFDLKKLQQGILRALEKRPVSGIIIDSMIQQIVKQLRSTGDNEVLAVQVGNLVMEHLRQIDQVAYIRFASVYRCFQDINEFRHIIDHLESEQDKEVKTKK
jgi:transcriptional repressor NrdR